MKLTIFGATGTIGKLLTAQALQAGHEVSAFSRGGWPDPAPQGLRDMRGDVLDAPAVAAAIEGADAVLCTLGAGRSGGVRAPGTANIVAGMQAHGVRRLICQSTLGAGDSAGNLNFFWRRIMFGLLLRPAFADHEAQERIVRCSGLDWTLVRPAAFTDGPRGAFRHGFDGHGRHGLSLKIPRADVAGFMLDQLEDLRYLRRCPGLST